jgi:hypothetical protein
VVGPTGTPLTLHDLPPANTDRWVIRRKAEVVAAVRGGLISLDDALARYRLTAEEFLAWQKAIDKWGMQGLRTTRIQHYGRGSKTNSPKIRRPLPATGAAVVVSGSDFRVASKSRAFRIR